jgi:sugar phosphate isomerase/epimerase
LKVGIDSYCYHRYFGEIYDIQPRTDTRWTYEKFISRAKELGVDGVNLETCFLPSIEDDYILSLKRLLDDYKMERVLAWGHPDGLEAGGNRKAIDDLKRHFKPTKRIGTSILRIVGSSLMFRDRPHEPQLKKLAKILREVAEEAESYDIILAYENHIDYTSDEIARLIEKVGSENLRVNFDTGNALRMFEDPREACKKLAPYTVATHVKDISPIKYNRFYSTPGTPRDWFFWASVPVGDGIVDTVAIAQILKESGYTGVLAVEIDCLKEGYDDEDKAVEKSIKYLRSLNV